MNVREIIIEYTKAHLAVQDNPRLLIESQGNQSTVDFCVKGMDRLASAEDTLFSLINEKDLPEPLQDFFFADSDKGCTHCWLSSNPSGGCENSYICKCKIARWFECRESLVKYGESLIVN